MHSVIKFINKYSIPLVVFISVFYIISNAFLSLNNFYYLNLLPLLVVLFYSCFYHLDKLLLAITFITPVSIILEDYFEHINIGMHFPTEPILFCVLIYYLFFKLNAKANHFEYSKMIFFHPLTISIFLYLFWMCISSFYSNLPIVSLKYIISKLWYIVSFYFIIVHFFLNNKITYQKFYSYYLAGLTIIIIWSTFNLFSFGFSIAFAHSAMNPFFKDHTSYGATIAFCIPFAIINFFYYKKNTYSFSVQLLYILACLTGLALSFSRAAWVSIICIIPVFIILYFRIKFKYIALLGLILISILSFNFQTFFLDLKRNNNNSSKSFSQHVASISNISTDDSNLERINRWLSAIEMFKKKPLLGFGPGTYAQNYSSYQITHLKTNISTNAGNKGNAHSEYIGALSESGFIGALTYIIILITVLYYGIKNYKSLYHENRYLANIVLSALLGLLTYVVHGGLNNFLDTDKLSVIFWGSCAIILSIDIKRKTKKLN